jgi:hypothetical protein
MKFNSIIFLIIMFAVFSSSFTLFAEESEMPFREKVNMYPPEHWEMFSATAFWRTMNVLNPKLRHSNDSELDTVTLAGLSAWSFRFQFSERWLPSATDPFCGYNCAEYILPKAGYDADIFYNARFHFIEQTQDKQFLSIDDFSDKIADGFDKQIITVSGSIFPHPSYGVVEGIERAKRKRHPLMDEKSLSPWVLIQLKKWQETDISNLYNQSLVLANQLYNSERIGHYASGRKAFSEWITALENVDANPPTDEEMLVRACFSNSWTYHCLLEARILAREFLHNNLDKFAVDQQLILDLVDIYDIEIKLLHESKLNLLPLHQTINYEKWTTQSRQAQINTLNQFLAQEEKAYIIFSKISQ